MDHPKLYVILLQNHYSRATLIKRGASW